MTTSDPTLARLRRDNRILTVVAGGSAAIAGAALVVALRPAPPPDTLAVKRLTIVNEDGRPSTVIAGRGHVPRALQGGKEIGDPRREGGFVFYDTTGNEIGGFVFEGAIAEDGQPSGGLHFSMDRVGGDQQLVLAHGEGGGQMTTGLSVYDRGKPEAYEPIYQQLLRETDPTRKAALQQAWLAAGGAQTERLFVGRTRGNSSALVLSDPTGAPRLMLLVTPEGKAEIRFLDAAGEVTHVIAGAPSPAP